MQFLIGLAATIATAAIALSFIIPGWSRPGFPIPPQFSPAHLIVLAAFAVMLVRYIRDGAPDRSGMFFITLLFAAGMVFDYTVILLTDAQPGPWTEARVTLALTRFPDLSLLSLFAAGRGQHATPEDFSRFAAYAGALLALFFPLLFMTFRWFDQVSAIIGGHLSGYAAAPGRPWNDLTPDEQAATLADLRAVTLTLLALDLVFLALLGPPLLTALFALAPLILVQFSLAGYLISKRRHRVQTEDVMALLFPSDRAVRGFTLLFQPLRDLYRQTGLLRTLLLILLVPAALALGLLFVSFLQHTLPAAAAPGSSPFLVYRLALPTLFALPIGFMIFLATFFMLPMALAILTDRLSPETAPFPTQASPHADPATTKPYDAAERARLENTISRLVQKLDAAHAAIEALKNRT